MSKGDERRSEARRRAEALLSPGRRKEAERLTEQERARRAAAQKIARLRELRLAKEAAEAAAKQAAKERAAAARRKPPKAEPV